MRKITKKRLNKKADIGLPLVIFLVLNLAFFITMFLFVQRVSSHALIYEEAYAKKIGLILNRAEPRMQFQFNVTDLVEIALKNGVNQTDINNIIKINSENGTVTVRARPEGGFTFPYYSGVKINTGASPTTRINGRIYYINIE